MKPRRVVIQLECDTNLNIPELRKARFCALEYANGIAFVRLILEDKPRVNVIRTAKPKDKERGKRGR